MKKILVVLLLTVFLNSIFKYNNIKVAQLFNKIVNTIEIKDINKNYKDSVVVSNFNFKNFNSIDSSKSNSSDTFILFFENDTIRKISRIYKNNPTFDYDIFIYYLDNFKIFFMHTYINIYCNGNLFLDFIFVQNSSAYSSNRNVLLGIKVEKLFYVYKNDDNKTLISKMSNRISTKDIREIFYLNKDLVPESSAKFSENILMSTSVFGKELKTETLFFYDMSKSENLNHLKLFPLYSITRAGSSSECVFCVNVNHNIREGNPIQKLRLLSY